VAGKTIADLIRAFGRKGWYGQIQFWISEMRPRLYPVTLGNVTEIHYRAAPCCRFFLRPQTQHCSMCPLIPDSVRIERNLEWMRKRRVAGAL
jgi:hypothetical protein